jgi:DNA processing protein
VIQLETEFEPMTAKRPTQKFIRRGEQELERWGYGAEVLTFLGLASLDSITFATLRDIGGPTGLHRLVKEHEGPRFPPRIVAALGKLPSSRAGFVVALQKKGLSVARNLVRHKIHFLAGADLPHSVRLLPAPLQPLWLFTRGDDRLLHRQSIAVVGTRHCTTQGEFLTQYVVGAVSNLDVPVVSGLAYGIDTIAHQWCLEISLPTISVIGSGLLALYPRENQELADRIAAQDGLLVSEYFPTQPPTAGSFVWRNRLQAAIARAVVATEWKKSSGTAHTIRFAQQFGRPNISVHLNGAKRKPEAGIAQVDLSLPRDHVQLMQTLSDTLHQPTLFKL